MEDLQKPLDKSFGKDPLLAISEEQLKTILHRSIGVVTFQTKSK
jgi:hypothetical protein